MKALPVWPSVLTLTALLLGLAGLLATDTSAQGGGQHTTVTCHVTPAGTCR